MTKAFRPSRRQVLRGAASLAAFSILPRSMPLGGMLRSSRGSARNVVLVWLNGGPSHLDTFDPKPGTRTGGPFQAIDTVASGVRICEHLPRLAKVADRFAIVRSLTSKEADHGRANQFLHSGHLPQETVRHPGFLSFATKEREDPESEVPTFVSVIGSYTDPGLLGTPYAPLHVPDANDPGALFRGSQGIPDARKADRRALLARMNSEFLARADRDHVRSDITVQDRALRLLGPKARAAFDVAEESDETRARFGDSDAGRGLLLARRLIENGVRFVEVSIENWDTHSDNFNVTQTLMGGLDPALASLLEDLGANGLLGETLILCMGEFGRTPDINATGGRDHHSAAFSVLLAGGGIKGGQVVGSTDPLGYEVRDRPVTIPDLVATIYGALSIDPGQVYKTPEGRPIKLVDGGKAVGELLQNLIP